MNCFFQNKPGPSHMIPQFITRVGRTTAPAYSLYSRPTDQKRNYTPAPGLSRHAYPVFYLVEYLYTVTFEYRLYCQKSFLRGNEVELYLHSSNVDCNVIYWKLTL